MGIDATIRNLEQAINEAEARVVAIMIERDALAIALEKCLNAMDMQVKREEGRFHVRQSIAREIWNTAVILGHAALMKINKKSEGASSP